MLLSRSQSAVLRRLILIGSILLAVAFTFYTRPLLYRIRAVDFAREQQQEPAWKSARSKSLAEYIEDQTRDRLIRLSNPQWTALARRLHESGRMIFQRPDRPPFNQLADRFTGDFTYLLVESDPRPAYLALTASRPGDYPPAPSALRHPLRRFAPWLLVVALAGYLLIPWPKRRPDVVGYSRFVAALMPDFLGLLFTVVFFLPPWPIVIEAADAAHPLQVAGGWIVLTVIMWSLSLFGLAIHAVAAWYETLCIRILDDGLEINSLRGHRRIPFNDILRAEQGYKDPPKALVRAGMFMSLLTWRAAGPTLLVASRTDVQLVLTLRNGRQHRFTLTGIHHLDTLLDTLKRRNIPVEGFDEPDE